MTVEREFDGFSRLRGTVRMRAGGMVVALLMGGCPRTHGTSDANDGGTSDGPNDVGPPVDAEDAGPDVRDVGFDGTRDTDTGPEDYRTVGEFRRCDRCSEICPGDPPGRCSESTGVCRTRDDLPGFDGCDFHEFSTTYSDAMNYCRSGLPCASRPEPFASRGAFEGECMTTESCLAAAEFPDLPEFSCVWADGTLVTRAPPPIDCPDGVEGRRYCGGSCSFDPCPDWEIPG